MALVNSLTLILALGGVVGVLLEVGTRHIFSVSPAYALFLLFAAAGRVVIREIGDTAVSGRERYDSGPVDALKRMGAKARAEAAGRSLDIEPKSVRKRDPVGDASPSIDDSTSSIVLGETGTGKSTFVKSRVRRWDFDGGVIAHALSESGGRNEFVEFFEGEGQDVIRISSRESTHRWDPFADFDESLRGMESIASGVFDVRGTKETGWSEPARALLVCGLTVTSARYGDFAKLPDVLERGVGFILDEMEKIPNGELAARPIRNLSDSDRNTVYTALLNEIRPLLQSQIFDADLPPISLTEYFASPGDRVIVLDNLRKDRYARGFWRLFCQSAIDFAFDVEGSQQFLLDEFDKLPVIENLGDLVSAGRSAGVRGILVAQDVHQMKDVYGDVAFSIWANSPNRVGFRPGDQETAELILSSIGEREMKSRQISNSKGEASGRQVSHAVEAKTPVVTGDLMNLDVGEVLLQSPSGWWLVELERE